MIDESVDLAKELIKKYKHENLKLSSAESCTGGLFAKIITDISGASTIFTFSAVTYSNDAKEKILNVKNMTLKKFGAVSEQTVSEMLDGLMSKKLSDIEIAVSGIAGPLSDDTAKEVGLVYIGVAGKKGKKIKEFRFGNIGRDKIRHNTVLAMLRMLLAHNL